MRRALAPWVSLNCVRKTKLIVALGLGVLLAVACGTPPVDSARRAGPAASGERPAASGGWFNGPTAYESTALELAVFEAAPPFQRLLEELDLGEGPLATSRQPRAPIPDVQLQLVTVGIEEVERGALARV